MHVSVYRCELNACSSGALRGHHLRRSYYFLKEKKKKGLHDSDSATHKRSQVISFVLVVWIRVPSDAPLPYK